MATLGEALATSVFKDGDWVESKDQDPDGDVRLVQMADVGDGYYLDKSARYLTSDTAMRLRCTYLEPGDLLLSRMPDPLGRCCVFPGDDKASVTVVDVCIIRPDPGVFDARWLMHCINSPLLRRQIVRFATGTTRARISRSNLAKIQIPLPSLEEQRRIAAILDHADALRAKRREALARLDELAQSIFIDMFGDPRGADRRPLGEVATVQIGPFGSLLHKEDYVSDGIPLVNPMHIVDGTVRADPEFSVSHQKFKELAAYHLVPGDVVMGRRGEMGRCAVVDTDAGDLLCGTGSLVIRPIQDISTPGYLRFALSTSSVKRGLEEASLGATMPNLNRKIVESFELVVPPYAAQIQFENRARSLSALKGQHQRALAELDALFVSLQSRAFRGEL
ncbi:restriction endonuclease subunit S [Nocardia cyriacigeorgica]|uniref:restriction endonuclease subunit S n=1 Tax=Nocardia cyriacigeorgica TaxID=135487 RepID=UPI0024542E5B|nr:restriction endonuclease subunit S [Nocardia cyriacigeorgica]